MNLSNVFYILEEVMDFLLDHFTIIMMLVLAMLVSCGPQPEKVNTRTAHSNIDGYTRVGGATISIKKQEGLGINTTVQFTSAASNTVTLDITALLVTESITGDILDLGIITTEVIKINNLKQCSGQKCTSAIVRIYTNDTVGHEGIGGMVNTTESYSGGALSVIGTSGSSTVGHLVGNAVTLAEYTIPANDKKLTAHDFTFAGQNIAYPISVDFQNAGYGDYEITIELEVALGI